MFMRKIEIHVHCTMYNRFLLLTTVNSNTMKYSISNVRHHMIKTLLARKKIVSQSWYSTCICKQNEKHCKRKFIL